MITCHLSSHMVRSSGRRPPRNGDARVPESLRAEMALGVVGVHCFVSITIVKRSAPAAWRTGTPAAVWKVEWAQTIKTRPESGVGRHAGHGCSGGRAKSATHPWPALQSTRAQRSILLVRLQQQEACTCPFGWAGSPSARKMSSSLVWRCAHVEPACPLWIGAAPGPMPSSPAATMPSRGAPSIERSRIVESSRFPCS